MVNMEKDATAVFTAKAVKDFRDKIDADFHPVFFLSSLKSTPGHVLPPLMREGIVTNGNMHYRP